MSQIIDYSVEYCDWDESIGSPCPTPPFTNETTKTLRRFVLTEVKQPLSSRVGNSSPGFLIEKSRNIKEELYIIFNYLNKYAKVSCQILK